MKVSPPDGFAYHTLAGIRSSVAFNCSEGCSLIRAPFCCPVFRQWRSIANGKYGNSVDFHPHKGGPAIALRMLLRPSAKSTKERSSHMGAREAANEAFVRKAYQIAENQDVAG